MTQLGTAADHLFGEVLKVPVPEIRKQREARNIPRFLAPTRQPAHQWTPDDISLLGSIPTGSLADTVGRQPSQAKPSH